jgi:hypothetical protein
VRKIRALLTQRNVAGADCIALLRPHSANDRDWLATHASPIFNARNAYCARRPSNVFAL